MHTFRGRTINELVFYGMKGLIQHGERTGSRNGDILVLYNCLFTLEHPRSRHLNLIGRKNNIFAMIAETMWVLAGEDRIDPLLSFFLPRAKDYSDDGETWRGGYGPRLYVYNQLEDAIRVFEEEGTQSRRSVISIYLPELDTKEQLQEKYCLEKTKDRPCNNMMHFFVSPDLRLHMTVHQRSGDVIWGMGSINVFEWTVLQEFVLSELQRRVDPAIHLGTYNHFVTNLHMYDATSKQGYAVVKAEYDQDFARLCTDPLLFPPGVEENQKLFRWLVDIYSAAIREQEQDFDRLMKKVRAVFDLFYSGAYAKNLLFAYATVVAATICARNGNAHITVDLSGFSAEFTRCIAASSFRHFDISSYEHPSKP